MEVYVGHVRSRQIYASSFVFHRLRNKYDRNVIAMQFAGRIFILIISIVKIKYRNYFFWGGGISELYRSRGSNDQHLLIQIS